jgi:hypothetical protein
MAAETEALAVADACLLAYLATDSEDSKDDEDFIPSIPEPLTTRRQGRQEQEQRQSVMTLVHHLLLPLQQLRSPSRTRLLPSFRHSNSVVPTRGRTDFRQSRHICMRPRGSCSRR